MIYIFAVIALVSSYYYIKDTNMLILSSSITIIIALAVNELSLGKYLDLKFGLLIEYMEGRISEKEAKGEIIDEDDDEEI